MRRFYIRSRRAKVWFLPRPRKQPAAGTMASDRMPHPGPLFNSIVALEGASSNPVTTPYSTFEAIQESEVGCYQFAA